MNNSKINYIDNLLCLLYDYINYFGVNDIKCKYLFNTIYNIFESDITLYKYFDISSYTNLYNI